jgi:hypothetical protein
MDHRLASQDAADHASQYASRSRSRSLASDDFEDGLLAGVLDDDSLLWEFGVRRARVAIVRLDLDSLMGSGRAGEFIIAVGTSEW